VATSTSSVGKWTARRRASSYRRVTEEHVVERGAVGSVLDAHTARGVPLRVGVDEQGALFGHREARGEVHGRRSLSRRRLSGWRWRGRESRQERRQESGTGQGRERGEQRYPSNQAPPGAPASARVPPGAPVFTAVRTAASCRRQPPMCHVPHCARRPGAVWHVAHRPPGSTPDAVVSTRRGRPARRRGAGAPRQRCAAGAPVREPPARRPRTASARSRPRRSSATPR
jgi:hypothetical protein